MRRKKSRLARNKKKVGARILPENDKLKSGNSKSDDGRGPTELACIGKAGVTVAGASAGDGSEIAWKMSQWDFFIAEWVAATFIDFLD